MAEGNAADLTDEAGYTVHSMDEILLADSVSPSFAVVRPQAAVWGSSVLAGTRASDFVAGLLCQS